MLAHKQLLLITSLLNYLLRSVNTIKYNWKIKYFVFADFVADNTTILSSSTWNKSSCMMETKMDI